MTRGMARANDYITRAECQALIVHTLNQVFSSVAEPTPYQDVNPAEESLPTDSEGAES